MLKLAVVDWVKKPLTNGENYAHTYKYLINEFVLQCKAETHKTNDYLKWELRLHASSPYVVATRLDCCWLPIFRHCKKTILKNDFRHLCIAVWSIIFFFPFFNTILQCDAEKRIWSSLLWIFSIENYTVLSHKHTHTHIFTL